MLSRRMTATIRTLRQQQQHHHHHKQQPDVYRYRTLSSKSSSSSSPPTAAICSQVFKPWPRETNGVVTCYGDYRQEAWLEKHIGGPLYAHQDTLPRLPVPTLHDTVQRFLPTATPLATSLQERDELEKKARDLFPLQAAHLQERLLQRAQDANASSSRGCNIGGITGPISIIANPW